MKVCMISYSVYEYDNRVHRYGEALIKAGVELDVICLSPNSQRRKIAYGTGVHYHIGSRSFTEKGPVSYLLNFIKFFSKSFFMVSWLYLKKKYDVVHYHNIPDFGVFAAIIPKIFGAKVLLDIHDIVPEFYMWKFNLAENHPIVRFLKFVERLSCSFADHVITGTHLWREKLVKRSVNRKKCSVIMNSPYPPLFDKAKNIKNKNRRFTMIYPGSLNEHFGVDIAVRGVALIREKIPDVLLIIYGRGRQEAMLKKIVSELDIADNVQFNQPVPREKIPEIIAESDIGIVPKRGGPFADEALSSKLLEFVYMNKPVVVSKTTIAEYYFNDSIVRFFTPENVKAFASCVVDLYQNPAEMKKLSENCKKFNETHSWEIYETEYFKILNRKL